MLIAVFGLSFLAMGMGIGMPEGGLTRLLSLNWTVAALMLLLSVTCIWIFLLSLLFAVWPGWRVRCDENGIAVVGLLGTRRFKWSEIKRARVGSSGWYMTDMLELRVHGRWWPYRFMVSGLQPDYLELGRVVGRKSGTYDE